MDILIPNLELPLEERIQLSIYPNGVVVNHSTLDVNNRRKAVELPPHEHLTEKSAFWNMLHEICVKCNDSGDINRYPNRCIWCKIKEAYEKVYQTPTVLEATE